MTLITDNASLITAVSSWLKRDDLVATIPYLIQMYESQMNRELTLMEPPHLSLEQTATGTLSSSVLGLPAGYSGTKRLKITTSGNVHILTYKPASEMTYEGSGIPRFYTTIGGNLEIGFPPDSSYAYEWVYYGALPSITLGSNWIIANAPDLYLYGTLTHSAPFLKNDARVSVWGSFYTKLLSDVEQVNTKNRQSGSPLQMRSDVAI